MKPNLNKQLTMRELIVVASTLFGLFFGAGNIIFPVLMGQMAGNHVWQASLGFIITATGLPLLAVAAMGMTHSEGVFHLASKISRKYAYFFTVALYLTIGPFFASPRTASVSFEVGFATTSFAESPVALLIYSALFFGVALALSLRPSNIMDYIGKFLNPVFLIFLAIIFIRAFTMPEISVAEVESIASYSNQAFFQGFLEGYNTMDVLAALAFGIIIIRSIRKLGVNEPKNLANSTVRSGLLTAILMGLIYFSLAILGTQSRGFIDVQENGGVALSLITQHYFGTAGSVILAIVMVFACLKTAIGLIVACAETFEELFPNKLSLTNWTILFAVLSFLVSNVGLTTIIGLSMPVLMFLYPLAISLVIIALCEPIYTSKHVYRWVTIFTMFAALFDFIKTLPEGIFDAIGGEAIGHFADTILPFYAFGFGWLVPALIGLVIGIILTEKEKIAS
ncbi:branched-chain amino acid transport system II carrier protein [Aerococcus urinaeequi]|uniref:branched-chain amino acid transport system II carrier protein n=1 Tax=Aerococcus urinaeequi TaxID=51665 RepID=UPI003AAB000D